MRPNVEVYLARYRRDYKLLYPDRDSLHTTLDLWEKWDPSGTERPDVAAIHRDCKNMEERFFYELVEQVSEEAGENLPVFYFPFCVNDYNLSAFSASDGYVVLVDEIFFGMLFMICVLISLDTFGDLADEEVDEVRRAMKKVIEENYFGRSPFYMREMDVIYRIMQRSFESVEIGNYLFQSFKAFTMLHEIGHHVHGHTTGTRNLNAHSGPYEVSIEVDERSSHNAEFEADAFGYRHFARLLKSKDNSRMTFFKYTFVFAPGLFFDICLRLDHYREARTGVPTAYRQHPHPANRVEALKHCGMTTIEHELYTDFKASFDKFFPGDLFSFE